MRVVVATLNPGKMRELAELLDLPSIELVSLAAVPGATAPDEHGTTLEENARIKARAAFALTGLPAIADDTGLEVDALGGRPGIHAARHAGDGASDAQRIRKLLDELDGVPPERRNARFRTVCVMTVDDRAELVAEGVLDGRIAVAPRGAHGFGYDPIFEIPSLARTLAELTPIEKNQWSHRARAVRALRERVLAART